MEKVIKQIVYADSRDGQATWKYEVIDRTISGKLVCKAVNHEDLGLILLDPDKVKPKSPNWSACPDWDKCDDEMKTIMTYCDIQCSRKREPKPESHSPEPSWHHRHTVLGGRQ